MLGDRLSVARAISLHHREKPFCKSGWQPKLRLQGVGLSWMKSFPGLGKFYRREKSLMAQDMKIKSIRFPLVRKPQDSIYALQSSGPLTHVSYEGGVQ
jgi:hypothetical protein